MKCKNISATEIRDRITRVDVNGKRIYTRDAVIIRNVKRALDIICEWKRHDCTMVYGGGVLTAQKKTFEGRIDIKNGPMYSGAYDAVILEYIKELL